MSRKQLTYFYVDFGVTQRSKGDSALRRSAYQRCIRLGDFDYTDDAWKHISSGIMLPDGADPSLCDPECLWSLAEISEKRRDAQVGRTFTVAIPREVPATKREAFAQHMLSFLVEAGFAVDWSIHNDLGVFDGGINPRVHAQATLRTVYGACLSRKKDLQFNALMRDDNGWTMRRKFAADMNAFLEQEGLNVCVTAEGNGFPKASMKVRRLAYEWREKGANPADAPEEVVRFLATRDSMRSAVADLEDALRELDEALEEGRGEEGDA